LEEKVFFSGLLHGDKQLYYVGHAAFDKLGRELGFSGVLLNPGGALAFGNPGSVRIAQPAHAAIEKSAESFKYSPNFDWIYWALPLINRDDFIRGVRPGSRALREGALSYMSATLELPRQLGYLLGLAGKSGELGKITIPVLDENPREARFRRERFNQGCFEGEIVRGLAQFRGSKLPFANPFYDAVVLAHALAPQNGYLDGLIASPDMKDFSHKDWAKWIGDQFRAAFSDAQKIQMLTPVLVELAERLQVNPGEVRLSRMLCALRRGDFDLAAQSLASAFELGDPKIDSYAISLLSALLFIPGASKDSAVMSKSALDIYERELFRKLDARLRVRIRLEFAAMPEVIPDNELVTSLLEFNVKDTLIAFAQGTLLVQSAWIRGDKAGTAEALAPLLKITSELTAPQKLWLGAFCLLCGMKDEPFLTEARSLARRGYTGEAAIFRAAQYVVDYKPRKALKELTYACKYDLDARDMGQVLLHRGVLLSQMGRPLEAFRDLELAKAYSPLHGAMLGVFLERKTSTT
jgi:tetratricopeptide (TPR) repeat protein